jgi:phosphohistidine phosphatase
MRTLYLIRHAKSSWDNPGLRDINRPLNDRGLDVAPRMARLLVDQGLRPDLLVSSPAKRALHTAQFFAEALGVADEAIVRNPDIYEAVPTTILRIVSELPEEAQTVCLFGHNPTLTEVANQFSEKRIANVPTCGIVLIESTAPSWREFYEGNAAVKATFFPKEVL